MKTVTNIFILSLVACLSLQACGGKKEGQTALDPGPAFKVDSSLGLLEDSNAKEILLHRDDPLFGPQIEIQPNDKNGISFSEKRILCPGLKPIEGKKISSPDINVFNFRLSESEFSDIAQLPLVSNCTLQIVLTNNIGSTLTRNVPVKLTFDKAQKIEISRFVSSGNILGINDATLEVELERVSIHNPFEYPVTFMFKGYRGGVGMVIHGVPCHNASNFQTCPAPFFEAYVEQEVPFSTSRISLSTNSVFIGGDSVTEVRFKVNPGETVALSSYGRAAVCTSHVGHYLRGLLMLSVSGTEKPSLTTARSFELGADDIQTPLVPPIQEGGVIPGTRMTSFGVNALPHEPL